MIIMSADTSDSESDNIFRVSEPDGNHPRNSPFNWEASNGNIFQNKSDFVFH